MHGKNMKKPTLKDLNKFAQLYIKHFPHPPTVKWKTMRHFGVAYCKKNIIYLNPAIPLNCTDGFTVGYCDSYKPSEKLILNEGEQYFFNLLHEMGHFKIQLDSPKEWISIRKKLIKINPDLANKRPRDEFDLHWRRCEASNYLKQKKNESKEDYQGRLKSFQSWLVGDWDKEHIAVEDWALKEFRKHRKRIKEILP